MSRDLIAGGEELDTSFITADPTDETQQMDICIDIFRRVRQELAAEVPERGFTTCPDPFGVMARNGRPWMERLRSCVIEPSDVVTLGQLREYAWTVARGTAELDDIAVAEYMWRACLASPGGRAQFQSLLTGNFRGGIYPWRWENYLIRWAHSGLPLISLTDKQTAAFALSDVDEEQLEEWRPPWDAFVVRLGDQGLSVDGWRVTRIVIWYASMGRTRDLRIRLEGDDRAGAGRSLEGQASSAKSMLTSTIDDKRSCAETTDGLVDGGANTITDSWAEVEQTDFERMVGLCYHVAVNAVIAMHAGPTTERRPKAKKKKGRRAARHVELPPSTDYLIGTDVKVDARRYVHDYLSGDAKRRAKLRWFVRGHWRWQAHGKGRKLRKRIYIEPHPAGRTEGPLKVKGHTVDGR